MSSRLFISASKWPESFDENSFKATGWTKPGQLANIPLINEMVSKKIDEFVCRSQITEQNIELVAFISDKQKIIALIAELGAAYGAIFGDECLDAVAQEIININQSASGSGALLS